MTLLRLASYNIQYGKGKDERFDLPRIVADLGCSAEGGPDLIALQEFETHALRSGMVHQGAAIAAMLPFMHWSFGAGIDVDASDIVDGLPVHRRRQFGNMVLSRWPILSSINHTLPKLALAGIFHLQRTLVETVVETPAGPLRFASVHLDHVSTDTRMPQVEVMLDLLLNPQQRGANWGGPVGEGWSDRAAPPMPQDVVVMGDMNFEPASPEYTCVIGDVSDWYGRTVRATGFADAWVAAGHAEADGDTIPHSDPSIGPRRIDHCFVQSRLAPFVKRMWIGTEAQGSDHNPIFCDLEIEGTLH